MFSIDQDFLNETGLSTLPLEDRRLLLAHIQEELAVRIGRRLSEHLTDTQSNEFENIIDGDYSAVRSYLDKNPDYEEDPAYLNLIENAGFEPGSPELLVQFSILKWLNENYPEYEEIASRIIQQLKQEIIVSKDSILGK